jgi:bacteriorhodopsin
MSYSIQTAIKRWAHSRSGPDLHVATRQQRSAPMFHQVVIALCLLAGIVFVYVSVTRESTPSR